MDELKLQNTCADFVKHFGQVTEGLEPWQIAAMCWQLANRQWSDGYRQGRYDPDFTKTVRGP